VSASFEIGTTTSYGSECMPVAMSEPGAFYWEITDGTLSPETTYHYRAKATGGGSTVYGEDVTFTTGGDATAPVMSSFSCSSITASGATISWITDEPTTSYIEYGPTTAYGSTKTVESTATTQHGISLTHLDSGKTYHYRVRSKDANNNESRSEDATFSTTPSSRGSAALAVVLVIMGTGLGVLAIALMVRYYLHRRRRAKPESARATAPGGPPPTPGLAGEAHGAVWAGPSPTPGLAVEAHEAVPVASSPTPESSIEASDVFISHVEEDANVALEIALCLEEAGYRTWCYQMDGIPGPSYLTQIGQAIDKARAFLLLISPTSLKSRQVTDEVIHAHEASKKFLPILRDITHMEFQARAMEWRVAVGASTSVQIPRLGVPAVIGRVVAGLKALDVSPRVKPDENRIRNIRAVLGR
jgi:hypothetical protein